jgi:hypothetical protein
MTLRAEQAAFPFETGPLGFMPYLVAVEAVPTPAAQSCLLGTNASALSPGSCHGICPNL